jgi:serine/threonine-protein kinase
MPIGAACHVVQRVAAALAYAHDLRDESDRPLQIVHRDVSPSNIMIAKTGDVKLLDFGIAKAADHLVDEKTRTGTLRGKLSYLAPEQVETAPADRRSDIFALGVVAFEALTGRRLFRGKTDLETLSLVRRAVVPPPSTVRPGIDRDLDELVLRMLARDPEERYQHCEPVVAALAEITHRLHGDERSLRRFVDEIGGPEDGEPAAEVGVQAEPGTRTGSSGEIRPSVLRPRPRRARHAAVALLGLVALVVAAQKGATWWRARGGSVPR